MIFRGVFNSDKLGKFEQIYKIWDYSKKDRELTVYLI